MNKPAMSIASISIVIVAILTPILIAIFISEKQAFNEQSSRVTAYAIDVIHRSDTTVDQIVSAFKALSPHRHAPCSEESISIMRKYDLVSSYIQAIGHMDGNQLTCISVGDKARYEVGPPDIVHPKGVTIRYNVEFPFAQGEKFIIVEQNRFSAIVHKRLPIDATTASDDISLATVSQVTGQIISAKGDIKPEWLSKDKLNKRSTVKDDDFIIATVPSERYLITAIAAMPIKHVSEQARVTAYIMVPVGLLAGLILVFAIQHLARLRQSMPIMIRSALKHDEFYMEYQPVVELTTGRWIGAEALIRWRRPNGESIRPDIFIPIAEETGIIKDITHHVIGLVERDCKMLWKRFPDFHVGINLSQADLHNQNLVKHFRHLVEDGEAQPRNLMIEITERGLAKPEAARIALRELRAMGFTVAIDDFGTGYSSLSHLETFELDILKIDKSFVDSVGTESTTSHVILHIIEMAKDLQLSMIAEGIETEAQLEFLKAHGVQYGQGWLFAKSMSIISLTRGLHKHRKVSTDQQ
jgi:sensor c-di-GMP phosphodiesterase-like protein